MPGQGSLPTAASPHQGQARPDVSRKSCLETRPSAAKLAGLLPTNSVECESVISLTGQGQGLLQDIH